ncbi:MAG: GNAT family N-acetyltransferase [candidate division Zixibacteria bacterium]|nr:GNAT family N-acetyltransferase [candidate division Zixibacteria bacterium]MDH3937034.1 GNAT family N-acetyltransferase [candidate division Zixibacteria bacterium]MDH4032955.1 GNAT family N-acetyltransferase [candidate division Zixibacteria bacterium]
MPDDNGQHNAIIETDRLFIRKALSSQADIEMYHSLWTNPQVMTNVGFPNGLKTSREKIAEQIADQSPSEYESLLVVVLKDSATPVGECRLYRPDDKGISRTDVKLLPEHWGNAYGVEVKRGLLEYLFTHTDCVAVQGDPNKSNVASQKMQEAVGGKRIGEDVYRFPEHMRDYTCDVHSYIYMVFRTDWEKRQS